MTENEDVTSTNGEQQPKPPCASGTKEPVQMTDNEIERLNAEIDQRALAIASDARDKYRKALMEIREAYRTRCIDDRGYAGTLNDIAQALKVLDK